MHFRGSDMPIIPESCILYET